MNKSTKVAVITGAAGGIGYASALKLAEKGHAVAIADRDEASLQAAAQRLHDAGHTVLALSGDVSRLDQVQAHSRTVIDTFGRIDVLVNNAGISQPKTILEISEEEWDTTIGVNLKGVFNWCKAVAQNMVDQGNGRIINMSSISANTGGSPDAVSKLAYCASKAGVLGLTRALAKELAPHVYVNALCPGAIRTNLTEGLIQKRHELITQAIPLKRIGTPEDIAVVVEFLATVEPCFITGEVIDVDGGQWIN